MSLLIFDRNRSVGMKGYPFLGRLLCLLFGLLFLLIVAPQQNPWTLNSVSSQFSGSETTIQIQVTLLHKKIEFSLYTLTWGTCLLLTGLIISSAQARWALMTFVRNQWEFLVGMILFLVLWWIKISLVFLGLIVGLLIVKPPPEVKHIIPFPCRYPGILASIVNYFHLSVLAETNTERMARCFVLHLWYAGIPVYSDRYPAFLAPVIETLQLSRRHVYLQEISLSPANFLLCTGYHEPRSLFRF